MPVVICFGAINANAPHQNAGIFVGEIICGGWDTNQKQNQGHGSIYGLFNAVVNQYNFNFDNFELIDGLINDQDIKLLTGLNM